MKKFNLFQLALSILAISSLAACSDDGENSPVVIPPNESGLIEIDGGGATYPNTVYLSLRSGEQAPVSRDKWDLAFYTGSEFKVLINGTTGAMVAATDKTDINAVTAEDITAVRDSGILALSFTNLEGILHVDDPANPLSKPAISAVSQTADENKVYILNRGSLDGSERPWKKIRIVRDGNAYSLQHADAGSTTFSTLKVEKDTDLNLMYVSFESGVVTVEPAKTAWDFAWTAGTSSTPYPQATNGTLAYYFQDLVYHNIQSGIGAAEVLEEDVAYADFQESDIPALTFNTSNRLTIGSNWRGGGGPSSAPAVRTDRYYVLKDAESNVYKVRFLSLTKDGERGKPTFEYELVEAGK